MEMLLTDIEGTILSGVIHGLLVDVKSSRNENVSQSLIAYCEFNFSNWSIPHEVSRTQSSDMTTLGTSHSDTSVISIHFEDIVNIWITFSFKQHSAVLWFLLKRVNNIESLRL